MNTMQNPAGLPSIIDQLSTMIADLGEGLYDQPLEVLNGASLGKHIRHIHDFYKAIVVGAADGIIDYNRRDRNEEVEKSPDLALSLLSQWQAELDLLEKDKEVWISPSMGYGAQNANIKSSIEREMMYAFDHAIHHLALIKIGYESVHDQKLPVAFGVAPSTLYYHQKP